MEKERDKTREKCPKGMEKAQYGRDEKEGDKVYFLVVKKRRTRLVE